MLKLEQQVAEIHRALLGDYDNHPGLVSEVRKHGLTLYGEDGKGGVIAQIQDVQTVKTVSRAAWVVGGILIAVFGNAIGTWLVEKATKHP